MQWFIVMRVCEAEGTCSALKWVLVLELFPTLALALTPALAVVYIPNPSKQSMTPGIRPYARFQQYQYAFYDAKLSICNLLVKIVISSLHSSINSRDLFTEFFP